MILIKNISLKSIMQTSVAESLCKNPTAHKSPEKNPTPTVEKNHTYQKTCIKSTQVIHEVVVKSNSLTCNLLLFRWLCLQLSVTSLFAVF